ncbi:MULTISPECIES: RHS repeat-associated core domain-containing protein [Pseudomonas fluorescens group]
MSARLHHKTPTINVIDNRGLPVRQVAYHRREADEPSRARIIRHHYDAAGRQVAQWDARLFANAPEANLQTVYSLSGKPLRVSSVDAGWRLSLPGDAGQVLRRWDQRGNHEQTTFDDQRRPVMRREQTPGQAPRTVECLRYGDSSPASAARNLCGALVRQDDSAGTLLTHAYALCANPLSQTRHLSADTAPPDWPGNEKDRDLLLEQGDGHTTHWRYDTLGQVIEQTDAARHQQRYTFDRAGQLSAVSLKPRDATVETTVASQLTYNASGQLESQAAGNGVTSRAVFDPATGRLTALSASLSTRTLQDLHYTYDPVGNVLRIEDKAQPVQYGSNQRVEATRTFTYDSLYQLIRATGRETAGLAPTLLNIPIDAGQLFNYTEHYTYDTGGNLTELRHVRERNHYTRTFNVSPTSNRLLSWNTGQSAPDVTMAFDANGNQQALLPGQALAWNNRNQLDSVVLVQRADAPDDVERYLYDNGGQRVRKVRTVHTEAIIHTREVRYLPGLEIHTRPNERLEMISLQAGRFSVRYLHWTAGRPSGIAANPMRYGLGDHLSSCSLELDAQGGLISQEGYLPYGGTAWLASRSALEVSYRTLRYCGKERDASGLYYYGQRYYAPWLQRWISPDPAGAVDGLNLYAMVANNPLRFVDHQGWLKDDVVKGVEADGHARSLAMMQPPSALPPRRTAGDDRENAALNLALRPTPGLSKTKRKDLVVHSFGVTGDTLDSKPVALYEYHNLSGPKSGPTGYRGVDAHYEGSAKSDSFYLNFGSYRIGNTSEYLSDLAERYRATKNDPIHRLEVDPELLKREPTLSRTVDALSELQPNTQNLIATHIERCNGILPVRAGGPGAHGEVRVLNDVVALYPGQAERVLSDTYLFTEKITGVAQPEPFIACFNCSGIIPENVHIPTQRHPRSYEMYNDHVQAITRP